MSTVRVDVTQETVTTAEFPVYTAPTAASFLDAVITGGVCTNGSATDTDLTVNIVQFSGTAGATNQYFPPGTIFAGRSDLLATIAGAGLTLKAGDFIVTKASAAGNLNFKLSIVETYSDS